MANNRLHIYCAYCRDQDPPEGSTFMLAKYYPSEGWYIRDDRPYIEQFNAWAAEHIHGGMWGDFLRMEYEHDVLQETIRARRTETNQRDSLLQDNELLVDRIKDMEGVIALLNKQLHAVCVERNRLLETDPESHHTSPQDAVPQRRARLSGLDG